MCEEAEPERKAYPLLFISGMRIVFLSMCNVDVLQTNVWK